VRSDEGISSEELLIGLELRLLDPQVRRTPEAVAILLADSFVEFGSSGRVFTKSEIVAELAEEESRTVKARGFASQELAPGVVLLTYRASADGVETLRSSVWVDAGDGWRMAFHQGTKVPPITARD
jgi:hypothetical protein